MKRGRVGTALLLALVAYTQSHTAWAADATNNDTLVFTEEFLYAKIGKQMLNLPTNMKALMNGTLKKAPMSPPREVNVSCLNSVAPAPLNWKMWCPNKDAKITEWVDEVGSTHRKIVLNPMSNMTATMALYFMTPMFPKKVAVNGKTFSKHYLWHPLDHVSEPGYRLAPGKGLLQPPLLMSKLNETYRTPAGKPHKSYKTVMWIAANDLAVNLPRNRYVLGLDVMGFQAFTLIVEFNDSPKGLVVSVEIILGAAASGYDPKNPLKGTPHALAAPANALLLETVMKPYRKNGDFQGALNAVTRHVVEEFSNLQHFVPDVYAASPAAEMTEQLETFKHNMIAATAALPVQIPGGFDGSDDVASPAQ